MILKIKDFVSEDDVQHMEDDVKWWMYDNIRRITWKIVPEGHKELGPERSIKLQIDHPYQDCSKPTWVLINVKRTVPEFGEIEDLFAIRTEAYICNDEGQTLEVLRPNG